MPQTPINFLIYGKIIIDDIRLADGQIVRGVLGGGGPQAAFGARLWSNSVGFLSRSGTDIEAEHRQTLAALAIDLSGWHEYADIPTPHTQMIYDEDEYLVSGDSSPTRLTVSREDWHRLLAQVLTLPANYMNPRVIHLITEFPDEPMVETAAVLRDTGAVFSLEPLIDFQRWRNRDAIRALLSHADVVTPDWPSASGMAESDEPLEVVKYWSQLGPRMVAVRHGQHGSYTWDRNHDQIWHIPAVPVDVADPTGAGNAYGGGLCVGWAETLDARSAGCYGAVSARFLVERVGVPEMSDRLQAEARVLFDQAFDRARQL